ncbi:hypothetical protein VNO77_34023 [Canavalia gladiata]|uniref:Uncharacterized protein n=1 Tax=Canavalia gladiata TaxID=3824 RepID=A0AAN9KGV2_CANGL
MEVTVGYIYGDNEACIPYHTWFQPLLPSLTEPEKDYLEAAIRIMDVLGIFTTTYSITRRVAARPNYSSMHWNIPCSSHENPTSLKACLKIDERD